MTYTLFDKINSIVLTGKDLPESDVPNILNQLDNEIKSALEGCKQSDLSLNRSLYLINKIYLCQTNVFRAILETSVAFFNIRTKLEDYLRLRSERQINPSIMQNMPEDPESFPDYIKQVIHQHLANTHYIYEEFIPKVCSRNQLKHYFLQEVTMDVNTDDFLALLQVGCDNTVKIEIARNYWDEMGGGKPERLHGVLFENIFQYRDISPNVPIEDITLEALVCGNIQILLAMYRKYFALGVGFFFTCEYMASGRFEKVISGWNRLKLPKAGLDYHELHVPLDVVHAAKWAKNVICPFSLMYPEQKVDILKGVLYRLNSSLEYLNMLEKLYLTNTEEALDLV